MDSNFGFVRVAAAVPTMRVADCRFCTQQFKRSAMPDGPKVVSVSCPHGAIGECLPMFPAFK